MDGVLGAPEGAIDEPEIVVVGGDPGVSRDGPLDGLGRLIEAPGLIGDDAEQVEDVGLVGTGLEYVAVDRLGFPQAARLMMVHGRRYRTPRRHRDSAAGPASGARFRVRSLSPVQFRRSRRGPCSVTNLPIPPIRSLPIWSQDIRQCLQMTPEAMPAANG